MDTKTTIGRFVIRDRPRASRVRVLAAIAACSLALVGCGPKVFPTSALIRKPAQVPSEVKFFVDGQPVQQVENVEAGFPSWRFPAASTLKGDAYTAPEVTAEVTLPCGHKRFPLRLEDFHWDEYTAYAKAGHPRDIPYMWPDAPDFRKLDLVVHNRTGEAGELRMGEVAFPVTAEDFQHFTSFVPNCDSVPVRLGGVGLGNLTSQMFAGREDDAALLVVGGGERCFQLRYVPYVAEGESYDLEIPKPKRLAGGHLYALPTDAVFAPDKVPKVIHDAYGPYGTYIFELKDVACR